MTTTTTLADRARGTAFEILYTKPATVPRELTKEEIAIERNRAANRERARAKRANKPQADRHNLHALSTRTGAMRDNKQYARWTI